MRRKALQTSILKNKNRLIELESEKHSHELVLERTSNLYRQAILERRRMTETWTAAVQSLNARNGSISEALEVTIRTL